MRAKLGSERASFLNGSMARLTRAATAQRSRALRGATAWLGAILFIVAAGIGFGVGFANAGQASSATGYYSRNGVDYQNWAAINTDPANNHQSYSVTVAQSTNVAIPSGWAGALPRKYNGSGGLVCTGTWTYNSGSVWVLNPAGCFSNSVGTWASKGQSKAWIGSSYATYETFLSPNQNS